MTADGKNASVKLRRVECLREVTSRILGVGGGDLKTCVSCLRPHGNKTSVRTFDQEINSATATEIHHLLFMRTLLCNSSRLLTVSQSRSFWIALWLHKTQAFIFP